MASQNYGSAGLELCSAGLFWC